MRANLIPLLFPVAALGAFVLAGATSLAAAENDAAITTMMTAADVKPSGDVDADFVAMMVPHHEDAIAMAQAELRHGSNDELRRIAQQIVVTQQAEIAAMRVVWAQRLPVPVPSPIEHSPMSPTDAHVMAYESLRYPQER
jgi:hypothetical protein